MFPPFSKVYYTCIEAGYLMHAALIVGEHTLRKQFYFSSLVKGMNFVKKKKTVKVSLL